MLLGSRLYHDHQLCTMMAEGGLNSHAWMFGGGSLKSVQGEGLAAIGQAPRHPSLVRFLDVQHYPEPSRLHRNQAGFTYTDCKKAGACW